MSKLTASAVVSFGSDGDAAEVLAAELDRRETGMNAGKISFAAADQPVFLIYASIPYTWEVSQGSGAVISQREISEHEADVVVALQPGENSTEIALDKPAVEGGVTLALEFGAATMSPGKVLADGRLASIILTLPALPEWDKRVRWLVGRLNWQSSATAIQVTPPAEWKNGLPKNARIVLMVTGE